MLCNLFVFSVSDEFERMRCGNTMWHRRVGRTEDARNWNSTPAVQSVVPARLSSMPKELRPAFY